MPGISNSIVGPNVTLGEGAVVNYSIIRDSIIGNYSNIDDVVLHHSPSWEVTQPLKV